MHPIKSSQLVGQTKLHFLLLMLLFLAACNAGNTPPPTPTPAAFTAIKLGIPADALNSPTVGTLDPNTQMKVNVYVKLNQSQQNQLQKITANQQDLEKEANKIGITDAQYEQIKNYLGIQNVTLHLSKLHTSVEVDGTAQTMSRLFQTTFVNHNYQNRTFYAPKTDPQLPTPIAQLVVSITGLDSYSPPVRTGFAAQTEQTNTQTRAQADCQGLNGGNGVSPKNVAQTYGYNQLGTTGKGLTINLIEIDGFSQDDVTNYGACVGYGGNITVKTIGPEPEPQGESTLDIEMIEGLAPDVNIVDYQTGDSRYLVDELQQLIDDNTNHAGYGNVVSISLGGAERLQSANFLNAINQELNVLVNTEHMTVFIASGDCGAFSDQHFGSFTVSFPASDPYAVGVGGTLLQTDTNGKRTDETVWAEEHPNPLQCDNTWGSGGGNSERFAQPSWQTGKGVQNKNSHRGRQVPDIGAVAFDLPLYLNGEWHLSGGTSAAAPIWAAGMVLVNQKTINNYRVFFAGPAAFYHVANNRDQFSPYFDVTEGGGVPSATFDATSGWDSATGLGVPNLPDFYKVLEATIKSNH
jgi:kumamolisin